MSKALAQQPRDYLGHPCRVAEAFDRFSDPVKEARKRDRRDVVRSIGNPVNELSERDEHSRNALELALDSLPNSTDTDKVWALLAMALDYDRETSNRRYQLTGLVLVALEHGKLLEVSHG